MKKKSEAQSVSDLLKKLQASYLSGKETEKKKSEKVDDDDEKFRQKLAAMLGKATASSEESDKKESKKKRSAAPKKAAEKISEEIVEETVEEVIEETVEEAAKVVVEEAIEEPIAEIFEEVVDEPVAEINKSKKKSTARSKKDKPSPVAAPAIEQPQTINDRVTEIDVVEEIKVVEELEVIEISEELEKTDALEETEKTEETDSIAESAEEPSINTTEEPLKESPEKSDPVTPAEQKSDDVIVIRPKQVKPSKAPAQEPKKNDPIRIVPRVTIPPHSDAYDFAKEKQSHNTDTIVIRPPDQKAVSNEVIVIRPRTEDKSRAVPRLHEDAASAQPIIIGKEVRSAPPTENTNPTMKKEKNITFIPPTSLPDESQKHTVQRSDDPPKPRTEKTESPVKKRKLQRFVNEIPVTVVSNDEDLEEVLDEPMDDQDAMIEEISVEIPDTPSEPPAKLSVFQRRQQQRRRIAEEKLSAAELIRKKSGLTEDDVAMILELGYENELGHLVGYENLKRLKSDHMMRAKRSHEAHYATSFGYRGSEYVGDNSKETAIAAYLYDRKALLLRLCLTSLLSLLILFVEMPHLIGGAFVEVLARPRLLIFVSTVLLCLAALPSLKQILAGARAFFRFSPTPYSVPALMIPTAILYDLVVLVTGIPSVRIVFPISLILLLVAIFDVLRLSCELRTLRLVSAEGQKHVLLSAPPRKKKLRHGKKIVKIINDDMGEPRYEVRQATQTTGFFRRFNDFDSAARPFSVLIYTLFSLATLSAFFSALYTSSATVALSTFIASAVLCMPLSAILIYFYPLCRANRLLAHYNCALVGEEAVDELSCPKTLIFRDTDLCSVEACTEIAVRDSDDFRSDLRLSCILFRKLGGTLSVLSNSVPPLAKGDPNVSVVRIQDDGVEAMIDHLHHVLAGSADFLRRGGVRIPRESSDKALRRTANVSPMYVAIDGVLKLNYEIQYKTDSSFESLIRDLSDTETQIALYSYNPNLTNDFLQSFRQENAEPIRSVKPGRFEETQPVDLADTGAVALGKHTDLAYTVYAATAIGAVRRFGFRMQLISTLLGAGISVLLVLLGEPNLLSTLTIAGYHGFWLLVSILATHSEINKEKLRLK